MRKKRFFLALYELLSSMRFAVGLLTLIAIASVIGTVLKQNEPYPNYQIEFGHFWFAIFEKLGLYDVYHAGWFLLIFGFLTVSTSLCIYRNFPGMMREMRSFRTRATLSSLRLMTHYAEFPVSPAFPQRLEKYLVHSGFRFRRVEYDGVVLWAAKKGSFRKLGYFLAHIGIVVICIGGLLDGNVWLKLQEIWGVKTPEVRNLAVRDMPETSRLSPQNLSFRANISVPEGRAVDFAWVDAGRGAFLQELPFVLELKAFHVEYYTTGQPKLFASDVIVQDKRTGKKNPATIKVNHPLVVDGIAIYQSSFGDGGSGLDIQSWDLAQGKPAQPIKATSLSVTALSVGGKTYRLEWGELRVFNIENAGADDAAVTGTQGFREMLQDARQVTRDHHLRNIGPSIQFKLRDAQGQAREYVNYMLPFMEEGRYYLLSGVRKNVGDAVSYIRFPLDDALQIDTFMRLRAALLNKQNIPVIARRTADKALAGEGVSAANYTQLKTVTEMVLDRFSKGGFAALERFLEEANVPQDKRSVVAQTYIRILQGAALETMQLAQEQAGLAAIPPTPEHYHFILDSLVAISQLFAYDSPMYLQLTSFQPVQASGFQITRSPGKTVVYLGALLLIAGILAMFYLRTWRLWVRMEEGQALLAMSSNRKNPESDQIFAGHQKALTAFAQETRTHE